MKRTAFLVTGIVILTMGSAQLVTASTNLIQNGSFEHGGLANWGQSGGVFAINDEGATDGTYACIFNRGDESPDGSIWQSFATSPGVQYSLSFDYGAYWQNAQQLFVQVTGDSTLLNTTAISLPGGIPAAFSTFNYDFTANSASTTLQFTDDPANATWGSDGVLDNVQVTVSPVPEPASMGLLAVASAGLLLRRRKTAGR